ncbi:MAG: DNA-processing protein DprA [Prevotella sp.]|nr:DNA-processing protein DprA [Prevotella sp.]
MSEREIICTIALTRINYFSLAGLRQLYDVLGSAEAVVDHRRDIGDVLPDASPRLVEVLKNLDEPMKRAEMELKYDADHGIVPLCLNATDYPRRLKECADAPLVLFYRGSADLNQRRVINIIGTRNCTQYGQDLIRRFAEDLQLLCPQVLIVSGLAYGVDICAHRQALDKGFETVGVLAHGLDDLYPSRHKETANRMLSHGGLLTEFMTQTRADKRNFVQRNRIVAGMSDACILIESASKGGGLITTGISRSYGREVFAFPGAVGAPFSEGCNQLIRDNGAALITSAEDFVCAMGWDDDRRLADAREKGIERDMFPDLSADEQAVVAALQAENDLQINMIATQTGVPIGRLTALLFELEMKGVVKTLAGGTYHLLK